MACVGSNSICHITHGHGRRKMPRSHCTDALAKACLQETTDIPVSHNMSDSIKIMVLLKVHVPMFFFIAWYVIGF